MWHDSMRQRHGYMSFNKVCAFLDTVSSVASCMYRVIFVSDQPHMHRPVHGSGRDLRTSLHDKCCYVMDVTTLHPTLAASILSLTECG